MEATARRDRPHGLATVRPSLYSVPTCKQADSRPQDTPRGRDLPDHTLGTVNPTLTGLGQTSSQPAAPRGPRGRMGPPSGKQFTTEALKLSRDLMPTKQHKCEQSYSRAGLLGEPGTPGARATFEQPSGRARTVGVGLC